MGCCCCWAPRVAVARPLGTTDREGLRRLLLLLFEELGARDEVVAVEAGADEVRREHSSRVGEGAAAHPAVARTVPPPGSGASHPSPCRSRNAKSNRSAAASRTAAHTAAARSTPSAAAGRRVRLPPMLAVTVGCASSEATGLAAAADAAAAARPPPLARAAAAGAAAAPQSRPAIARSSRAPRGAETTRAPKTPPAARICSGGPSRYPRPWRSTHTSARSTAASVARPAAPQPTPTASW